MKVFKIEETASSPGILFNKESGEFRFYGRSLPEDPIEFYQPVLDWFDTYIKDPLPGANFELRLTYFNTASSKVFFSIFQMIDKMNLSKAGIENKIVIFTNSDDEDLMELFEYYKELLSTDCLDLRTF